MPVNSTDEHPLPGEIPSFETFMDEIQMSFPEGDLVNAYNRIVWFIEKERTCSDGTPITYRLIMDRFAAHIRQWNTRYGRKEQEGFLSKEAEQKRKPLFEFIGSRWYERIFTTVGNHVERDPYLFGNFPLKYLSDQLDEFQKNYQHGKATEPPEIQAE